MNKKDRRRQQKKKQRAEKLRQQKHLRHFGGDSEWEATEFSGEDMPFRDMDSPEVQEQFQRIDAILGDSGEESLQTAVGVYFRYLQKALILPCEVTGVEDFRWEEYYIIGPGPKAEHDRLRRKQPSYMDRFELTGISLDEDSEWMLFQGDDIAAHVTRISDQKPFILGLAELKAVDKQSPNFQLLDDFGVFLVNNR
jgi:hypothetical protein